MQTIAAIGTPKGNGGIGIVRVSGDDSLNIVNKIFVPYSKKSKNILGMPGYTAKLGKVVFEGELLDEAIVFVFRSPKSYTGENVVEISCHGGLFVLNRVLDAVLSFGARLAMPGEFTKRAVLNGKMSIIQAESVKDIIEAKSKSAAKLALLNKEGVLNERIFKIKENLTYIIAKISVSIDYPEDEDLSNINYSKIKSELHNLLEEIEKLLKTYKTGRIIKDGVDTVIVGKPNVGKSSLMNALVLKEKSIITDIPGTTRDIVEETIFCDDVILNLKDTAGIRNSENIIEKIGIEKSLEKIKEAELVLAVFDASEELSEEDKKILNILKEKDNIIGILNKSDLPKKINLDHMKKNIKNIVSVSAKKNVGIEKLKENIKKVSYNDISDPEKGILTTKRQFVSLEKSSKYIKKALDQIDVNETADLIMDSLDSALEELLILTGEKVSQTVTDEIFSKFCVGK